MSRVVKNVETGEVLVICKGADSSILPRSISLDPFVESSIETFANQGYRTLTFGYRNLKNDMIDVLTQNEIESGLTLFASTGVEDLL